MTSNIENIKNKRLNDWFKDVWPDRVVTRTEYLRLEKLVRITYLEREGSASNLVKGEIHYPILNTYNVDKSLSPALAPNKMQDKYSKSGYIMARGHNLASISGLKVYLKDIGIKTNIVKDQNYSYSKVASQYAKISYKIYPKTDVDYAMFMLYFNEEITTSEREILLMKPINWRVQKLPISSKWGNITKKSNKKRYK